MRKSVVQKCRETRAASTEKESFIIDCIMAEYTVRELADCLFDYMKLVDEEKSPEPIRVTEEQFKSYFKIIGKREDGTPESRGRKKRD